MGKNLLGLCLFFWVGELVLIEYKVAWAEAYLRNKRYLSPTSRLATTDICRKLGAAVPI